VFFKKFDFDPEMEMDPEPDPKLSEKLDPDPEITFSAPTHCLKVVFSETKGGGRMVTIGSHLTQTANFA